MAGDMQKETQEAQTETTPEQSAEGGYENVETAGESGNAQDHAEPVSREEQLLAQIEQLQQEKEENYNKFLRAQADLQNFRTRVNKEKEQLHKYASQKVIEALLPIIDNFDRAVSASKETKDFDNLVEGVDMVFRQLQQILVQEEVTPLPGVGEPFDPNLHQAVMQQESSDYAPGIIIEEFQKGYRLKDRVIRPSMVKVSS
ncbi:nucleotide exchange factor GrpE [Aneurinibacillus sp. Ricciae_BoGa-3]|uniref:nucleotide exchange factor GrpE n=1 Tax=Aneurinibacillus sp. Ricciae_BoGa-3 TaxID=3022697 RepID=UPI0023406118|nr:nucleotide exchange factor GrpE [Aneurinibacillus sp. Ricciae_BoGa-3]WCK53493.1 nucleotide exchange factor GrpE [Aneurinibacillus sp. Ricciae_BoGa-3]